MTIKRLAIYCGALQGKDPDYMVEAEKVGEWLAAHQIELVYGGGQHGLMGGCGPRRSRKWRSGSQYLNPGIIRPGRGTSRGN